MRAIILAACLVALTGCQTLAEVAEQRLQYRLTHPQPVQLQPLDSGSTTLMGPRGGMLNCTRVGHVQHCH